MAQWTRMHIRLPQQLHDAVTGQASRLGISQSEYIRQALVAYAAWHRALDAVDDGDSTDDLRDPQIIARFLGERSTE